ncbi:MAG TPA: CDP-alcohol phosphatidyltransferase family protein [Patescibacteria group bacterium]|nr:CDP-alcohol phosphatidyltransferase family protein [Patescibacteria group bacterium]
MISKFKQQLQPLIGIIAHPFLSWNPSVLTLLSLSSALVFFLGAIFHIYWLSIVSILGFLFDAIDGYVARKTGKVTKFGGFLDSTTDRIADALLMSAFGYAGLVSWTIVVPLIVTSLLISYIRARGEFAFLLQKSAAEGLMQRTERIIILYVLFLAFVSTNSTGVLFWGILVITILNCFTILQRLLFFARQSE